MAEERSHANENADARLPVLVGARAAIIVTGALAACSWVTTFFVSYIVIDQSSLVPRPLGGHFDRLTIVNTVLFAIFFAFCLRAHRRARARAQVAGLLNWAARLVPYAMGVGALAGIVTGVRAGKAHVAGDEDSARILCAEMLPASERNDRCLGLAITCARVPRDYSVRGDQREACLRKALGLAATSP